MYMMHVSREVDNFQFVDLEKSGVAGGGYGL